MQHISGIPRNQMCFSSLEDTISSENPIRFIDAFVAALSLEKLGFSVQTIKTKGCFGFKTTYCSLYNGIIKNELLNCSLKNSVS